MMNNENNENSSFSNTPPTPDLPMKWHKFLIYFSLWAAAVLNIVTGVMVMTGAHYEGQADLVYMVFSGMKTIDTIYGLLLMAAAVFSIIVRFRLAGYRLNGISGLSLLYMLIIGIEIFYYVAAIIMVGGGLGGDVFTALVRSVVPSAVMLFVNRAYYAKRAHLFS